MARPKPVVLVIMDGWGIAPPSKGNAISLAKKPVFDHLISTYPVTTLQASGEAVGLSWGEMGNSEVGHLNLGSGRIIYQTLPRINKALEDGSLAKNDQLKKVFSHVKKNNSRLHLFGLVSNGGVHSHQDHLFALLDICKKAGVSQVYIHAMLDGRDTKKDGGLEFIKGLQNKMTEVGLGQIASLAGRFYTMDRDNHWDRVEKGYKAMALGQAENKSNDPIKAIQTSYQNNIFDEEFIPTVITKNGKPLATIEDKDAMIFFNYRADRARQISMAFALPTFTKFDRQKNFNNLLFVTFTQYEKNLPVEVIFPPTTIETPLGKLISENNLSQLHAAETEKYAHVTFFFNGGKEDEYPGESRILVPSPAVSTYDQKPEMSAYDLTAKVVANIKENKNDFIVINYANTDMVAHTGVIGASVKATETVDKCLGDLVKCVLGQQGVCLITADHGNCEELINLQTGEVDKEHSTNPVPFLAIGNELEGQSLTQGIDSAGGDLSIITPSGILADISPTVLKFLNIPQPPDMSGSPLL